MNQTHLVLYWREREEKWKSLGFIPFKDGNSHKYRNVLFAAPPGSGGDGRAYANEVENAIYYI